MNSQRPSSEVLRVGIVQGLHHFEAKAGTVTKKHGELRHGCPGRPHDAGLLGHPLALSPLACTTWPADAAFPHQAVALLMQMS